MNCVRPLRERESRSTRRVEGYLQLPNGREIPVLVTNISNRGCRLKPQEPLTVDDVIRIAIPKLGSVAATVRWISNEMAGAEFVLDGDVWEEVPQ